MFRVTALQSLETVSNVQRNVNQNPISLGLDFVVPEEDIGPEVAYSFVDDILESDGKECFSLRSRHIVSTIE